MAYPVTRMRRLRKTSALRRMVTETRLLVDELILPLFVCPGKGVKTEISAMPGNYQLSVDELVKECKEVQSLGIPAVILFGIPSAKDAFGTEGTDDNGIVQTAVKALKDALPDLVVITDVCLCEYTDHGHCGLIRDGEVDNDSTLKLLSKMAVSHARAGADIVAPSDMMDGRVGAIRRSLDEEGFADLPVMAYSAKFASAYYGPFREAAESAPQFGDRKAYQMNPGNVREAMREIELDIDEGADVVMVKPALAYLDIIAEARKRFDLPLAAYNVSGEFSMIKAAAAKGWIDGDRVMMETLLSIRRAGADLILTYFAKDAARILNG